jgi:hypothetical protein
MKRVIFNIRVIRLALSLVTATLSLPAQQNAAPPEGSWYGTNNGVSMNLTYRSGTCAYRDPYLNLPGNHCAWQPTATNGGILTVFYDTYTVTQVFHNKLLIGVTYANRDRIVARLAPGPNGAATLDRQ